MNAFEIRIVIALVLAVSLLAGGTWTGYHFTRQHYELIEEKEKTASETVLANARQAIIDLTKERDKALQKLEEDHATWVQNDNASRAAADERVRGLTATIRSLAMSRPVADTGSRPGSGSVGSTGGDSSTAKGIVGLDSALTEYNAATDNLIDVCQRAARSLKSIYEIAPPLTPVAR